MKSDKIIITGPESSGKTTLAEALARALHLPLQPEYARKYLTKLSRKYTLEDVLHIGWQQLDTYSKIPLAQPIILDTDILTTIIWLSDKFSYEEPRFNAFWEQTGDGLYLLCKPELEWEEDPLREDPGRRDFLYAIYKSHLVRKGKQFFEISGNVNQRLEFATALVRNCCRII